MSAQMSRAEMRDEYWADGLEADDELADADSIARRHGWRDVELLIQSAAEELPGEA